MAASPAAQAVGGTSRPGSPATLAHTLAQVTGKEVISRRLPRCDRTVPTGAAATTLGSAFVVKLLSARSARPGKLVAGTT